MEFLDIGAIGLSDTEGGGKEDSKGKPETTIRAQGCGTKGISHNLKGNFCNLVLRTPFETGGDLQIPTCRPRIGPYHRRTERDRQQRWAVKRNHVRIRIRIRIRESRESNHFKKWASRGGRWAVEKEATIRMGTAFLGKRRNFVVTGIMAWKMEENEAAISAETHRGDAASLDIDLDKRKTGVSDRSFWTQDCGGWPKVRTKERTKVVRAKAERPRGPGLAIGRNWTGAAAAVPYSRWAP